MASPGRGFADTHDPLLVEHPATMLAAPNYVLFLSIYVLCLMGTVRLHTLRIRQTAIIALATFAILEVGRWTVALIYFSELSNDFLPFDLWTWLVSFVVIFPLVWVTRKAWRVGFEPRASGNKFVT